MTHSPAFWIGYIVLIFCFMYFIAIRPQQKEKKNAGTDGASQSVTAC